MSYSTRHILARRAVDTRVITDRYATIESADTPTTSSPSTVESIAPSEAFSPSSASSPDKMDTPPVRPSEILSRSSSSSSVPRISSASASNPFQNASLNGQAPSSGNAAGPNATDALWQAAIQHMMQSPAQFQRIMQAFASQQQPYANIAPDSMRGNTSALSPYDAGQADYGRWLNQTVAPSSAAPIPPPHLPPVDDSPMQLLIDESNQLQKSYHNASEINADMDMLQTSINSLIQDLGIDPGSLSQTPDDHGVPHVNGMNGATTNGGGFHASMPHNAFTNGVNGMGVLNGMGELGVGDNSQPDFLLDSLLSQIGDAAHANGGLGGSGGGLGGGDVTMDYRDVTDNYDHSARIDGTSIEDASTEQLTAFLDEASSASSEATPANGSPLMSTHQKRKSEVMIDVPMPSSPEGGAGKKVKRKR